MPELPGRRPRLGAGAVATRRSNPGQTAVPGLARLGTTPGKAHPRQRGRALPDGVGRFGSPPTVSIEATTWEWTSGTSRRSAPFFVRFSRPSRPNTGSTRRFLSHDMRTPLKVIKLSADLLTREQSLTDRQNKAVAPVGRGPSSPIELVSVTVSARDNSSQRMARAPSGPTVSRLAFPVSLHTAPTDTNRTITHRELSKSRSRLIEPVSRQACVLGFRIGPPGDRTTPSLDSLSWHCLDATPP